MAEHKFSHGLSVPLTQAPEPRFARLFDDMMGKQPERIAHAVAPLTDGGAITNLDRFVRFLVSESTKRLEHPRLNADQALYVLLYTAEGDEDHTGVPYALSKAVFREMNSHCRSLDLSALAMFKKYMYGLMYSVHKLDTVTGTVYRGVKLDLSTTYKVGEKTIWYSFTSCTTDIATLKTPEFCGADGARTILIIHLTQRRARYLDIMSLHEGEKEVGLPFGTTLLTRCITSLAPNQYIVQMDEVEPADQELEKVWKSFGAEPDDEATKELKQQVKQLEQRLAHAGNPYKIPVKFLDPFTYSVMGDPVKADDGNIYERSSITAYIHERMDRAGDLLSPLTKEPMKAHLKDATEDDECQVLKNEIEEFRKKAYDPSDALTLAGDSKVAASMHSLDKIFKTLDELDDILQQTLTGWQSPQIVVIGKENSGKSTLLERLCMMSLFPQARDICTRMAIRVIVQRTKSTAPPTIQVWDTDKKHALGEPRIIPASMADADVKATMDEVIAEAATDVTKISLDKELRITISSKTLPPLNFVDLPGVVAVPPEAKERTEQLVKKYVSDNREYSTYLLVVEALETPRNSIALALLMNMKLLDRTIGVFTKCDRLEEDEIGDFKESLTNKDSEKHITIQPHGYVATSNRRPAGDTFKSSNFARINQQAVKEEQWFRESGFEEEVGSGKAMTAALVDRVTVMFEDYVKRTWIPRTVGLLYGEYSKCQHDFEALGMPVGNGELAGNELEKLVSSAVKHAMHVLEPVRSQASLHFGQTTLEGLRSAIRSKVPDSMTVDPFDVNQKSEELVSSLMEVCVSFQRGMADGYTGQVWNALQSDGPFCLSRFPRLMQGFADCFQDERLAPSLVAGTLANIEKHLRGTIQSSSPSYYEVTFQFDSSPPKMVLNFTKKELLVTKVVSIFFRNFSFPSGDDEALAVAKDVFDESKQEKETCHARRVALMDRKSIIEMAIRKLVVELDDETSPADDESLQDLVKPYLDLAPPLPPVRWDASLCNQHVCLSNNNRTVLKTGATGWTSSVIAEGDTEIPEYTLRYDSGPNPCDCMIGYVQKKLFQQGINHQSNGWFYYAYHGYLFWRSGDCTEIDSRRLCVGDLVKVSFSRSARRISWEVNGTAVGAFDNVGDAGLISPCMDVHEKDCTMTLVD